VLKCPQVTQIKGLHLLDRDADTHTKLRCAVVRDGPDVTRERFDAIVVCVEKDQHPIKFLI
jgi:hypothetical protein